MSLDTADGPVTTEDLVEVLSKLARGAHEKMVDKAVHAEQHPRRDQIPRWGETYWAGYLHGVCAAIAAITGDDSTQVALRYEELTP